MDLSSCHIAIIDPDLASREALILLCQTQRLQCSTYPHADALLADSAIERFQCIVIEPNLSASDGLAVVRQLRKKPYCPPLILITAHATPRQAVEAIKLGAVDYIAKPYHAASLISLISQCLALDTQARQHWQQQQAVQSLLAQLTPRERDVTRLMLQGRLNKQMADDLSISLKTIEVHRARALEKMRVNNAIELLNLLHYARIHL